MIKIQGRIDQPILDRSAYVHPDFKYTDCAVALVLKELFPGIHVRRSFASFCNKDGYDVTILLPEVLGDWIGQFDRTKPADRRSLPHTKFKIDVPQLAIDSIGIFTMDRILKSSYHLTYA